jgi:hypothetical protein
VPPVPVRQAVLADLETLVPLFDGYRQFYAQPSDLDNVRVFLHQRLTQRDAVLFIAEAYGRAAGFTQLFPRFRPCRWRGSSSSTICSSSLKPDARTAGAIRLSLSTAITNTAAQALYASAGWQRDEVFSVDHPALPRP